MNVTALAAFATTIFLMVITPGPAVMQVIGHSLNNGCKAAQASIMGLLTANALYCGLWRILHGLSSAALLAATGRVASATLVE